MRKDTVFSFGCLILGIVLLVESSEIVALWPEPMGPEVFPYILSGMLIASSAFELFSELISRKKKPESNKNSKSEHLASNKPVIFVAIISLLYVFGLTYLGFYISTIIFVLVIVGGLSYFNDKNTFIKKTVTVGIPLAAIIVLVLVFAHKYMHIYYPTNGLLW